MDPLGLRTLPVCSAWSYVRAEGNAVGELFLHSQETSLFLACAKRVTLSPRSLAVLSPQCSGAVSKWYDGDPQNPQMGQQVGREVYERAAAATNSSTSSEYLGMVQAAQEMWPFR